MPAPFPGMDPYLEGPHRQGFCVQFFAHFQRLLAPLVQPRYYTFIDRHVYLTVLSGDTIGRIRPDVGAAEWFPEPVRTRPRGATAPEPRTGVPSAPVTRLLEAPVYRTLPRATEVEEQIFLEIRDFDTGRTVCVIEVLSPENKDSGPGRDEYLQKRERILRSDAHLVELDFLRRGARLPTVEPLPPLDYLVSVSRSQERPRCGIGPISLRDPLPTIPIPLLDGNDDVLVELQAVFPAACDAASFLTTIRYDRPLRPALSPDDAAWARGLLQTSGAAWPPA